MSHESYEDRRRQLYREMDELVRLFNSFPEGYAKDVIQEDLDRKAQELKSLLSEMQESKALQKEENNPTNEESQQNQKRSGHEAMYAMVVLLFGVSLVMSSYIPVILGFLLVLVVHSRKRRLTTSDDVRYRQTLTDERKNGGSTTSKSGRYPGQP